MVFCRQSLFDVSLSRSSPKGISGHGRGQLQTFRPLPLLCALAGALLIACSGPNETSSSEPPSGSELQFDGVVRHIDIEGGAWVIESAGGTTYEPINLPEGFKQNGLAVRVWANREEDRVSVRMVGPIISIAHIELRE